MHVVSGATSQKGVAAARGRGGGGAKGWKIEKRVVCVCVCVGWLVRDEHCLAGSTPAFAGIIHALGGAQRLCSQTG